MIDTNNSFNCEYTSYHIIWAWIVNGVFSMDLGIA